MQDIYREPVKPELIAQRIAEIKEQGVVAAASLTPQKVRTYYEVALEAGLDILVIQGTVVSPSTSRATRAVRRSTSRSSSASSRRRRSSSAAAPRTTPVYT